MATEFQQDTAIRSEGAELFVQAYLMLEMGIIASMASRNMPGYDVLATNPQTGKLCRIQVKYRKAINSDGARLHNFDFDFMVYVAGNLGYIGSKIALDEAEKRPTEFYILPVDVVQRGMQQHDRFPNPQRSNYVQYRGAWHLIREHLQFTLSPVLIAETDME